MGGLAWLFHPSVGRDYYLIVNNIVLFLTMSEANLAKLDNLDSGKSMTRISGVQNGEECYVDYYYFQTDRKFR